MVFDRRETAILLIGDFLILVASLYVALFIRNLSLPSLRYLEVNVVPFLPMFCLSLIVFYIAGLYEKQTRPIRRVMGLRVLGAQIGNVAIDAILFFILPLTIAPKTILILYLIVSVIAVSAWRFYRMQREIATSSRTPALIIGTGIAVEELFEEVQGNSRFLIHFVEKIDTNGLPMVALEQHIRERIQKGIGMIVIDTHDPRVHEVLPSLYEHISEGIPFVEFASLYEEIFDRVPLDHIGIERVLESLPKRHFLYDSIKRMFDIVLAGILSLVALPFIALGGALVAVQGGSVFIFNERVGKGGKPMRIIKLRTMLMNDYGDPELQKKNRVTALGKVLRKTRVDELPQLWNVLAGDLSFIGPRPELPKIAEVYEREIPYYKMRYLIAPGLSGWAQIHDYDAPKGGADVARTRKKLSFDLYYLKHRSIGLDFTIALKTVRALTSLSGT